MYKKPHSVDIHVGQKLKERRIFLGLSQEELGNSVDLTFQQIQKYESGANRISASKLFMMSELLNVPIPYFFEGLQRQDNLAENDTNPLMTRETIELCRYYFTLPVKLRKQFFSFAKMTAGYFPRKKL